MHNCCSRRYKDEPGIPAVSSEQRRNDVQIESRGHVHSTSDAIEGPSIRMPEVDLGLPSPMSMGYTVAENPAQKSSPAYGLVYHVS